VKALVTGGAGFIGSNLVDRLIAESRLSLADATKANRELGWNPQIRLEDWISQHK
jgi:nucleoside-diphosphate-sugar epimerase